MHEFIIDFKFARKNFPIFLKIMVTMNHLFHLSYFFCPCKGNSAGISSLGLSDSDRTESTRKYCSYWEHSNASWRKLPVDIQKTVDRKEIMFLSIFTLQNFKGEKYSDTFLYYYSSIIMYSLIKKMTRKYIQSVSDGFAKCRANFHPNSHCCVWSMVE